ncbi:apolipo L4-like protein [Labeo rohita]|uniref:Apolipo L4-like protein n=1 Tax=Labeo rohita TaxID=84645 RepID=A0A498LJA9_LABRO|nr:apolipo L4-like protein [Labeo rohita]
MRLRAQLVDRLAAYVEDTLDYIETVRVFCDQEQKWTSERKAELDKMRDINENQQEGNLGAVITDTLKGLEKLEPFLDAVEKLTVTSQHVFRGQIFLLWGKSPEIVQLVITNANTDAPVLILFKRNAKTFFQPLLNNVNVLIFQLNNYVLKTKQLCSRMRRRRETGQPSVKLILRASENDMNQMLDHLKQLREIRMDEHTRLAYLFQEDAQKFTDVFGERRSRMWQLLSDLEDTAVHLDRMKKGASISTVVGSSVGIIGGVLSVLGVVLIPVTAGTSLGLTVAGAGLGGVSVVNALATDSTEMAVNSHHEHKAQSYLKSFKDDMIKIEDCLNELVNSERPLVQPSGVDAAKIARLTGEVIRGGVNVLDEVAAIPLYKSTKAISVAMRELNTARNIPQVATYLSRTEQVAKAKMMTTVRVVGRISGIINFLFIGLDGYSIYEASKNLAQGSETEVSKLIRSRAVLWKSELEACEKMYDSLRIGKETISKRQEILEKPLFL